jgi:L-lactate utilization protein LutC
MARLRDELAAAGGVFHPVASWPEARIRVVDLLRARGCRRVLVGPGVDGIADELRLAGMEVVETADNPSRAEMFAADAGVSGVKWLIAETGSIVVEPRPGEPRGLSLLPPVHVAAASRSRLLADLFDLFEVGAVPPSCLTLITGPSKTGDIELKLVTGVHGPGEVHLVVIDSD